MLVVCCSTATTTPSRSALALSAANWGPRHPAPIRTLTVGLGISPSRPCLRRSRVRGLSPPVGTYTHPRRGLSVVAGRNRPTLPRSTAGRAELFPKGTKVGPEPVSGSMKGRHGGVSGHLLGRKRGCSSMVRVPAFQAGYASSILVTRSGPKGHWTVPAIGRSAATDLVTRSVLMLGHSRRSASA